MVSGDECRQCIAQHVLRGLSAPQLSNMQDQIELAAVSSMQLERSRCGGRDTPEPSTGCEVAEVTPLLHFSLQLYGFKGQEAEAGFFPEPSPGCGAAGSVSPGTVCRIALWQPSWIFQWGSMFAFCSGRCRSLPRSLGLPGLGFVVPHFGRSVCLEMQTLKRNYAVFMGRDELILCTRCGSHLTLLHRGWLWHVNVHNNNIHTQVAYINTMSYKQFHTPPVATSSQFQSPFLVCVVLFSCSGCYNFSSCSYCFKQFF